jgi:hypothetical protein
VFLILVLSPPLIKSDRTQVSINCSFDEVVFNSELHYWCFVSSIEIDAEDENVQFTITGSHQGNKTNRDVTWVELRTSNAPFVINEFFTTFENLRRFRVLSGGLQRIQSFALADARNLEDFFVQQNRELSKIEEFAFVGASSLERLEIVQSSVQDIHENAFIGLSNLRTLNFNGNRLHKLPQNVFRSLPRLRTVAFASNRFQKIDSNMFPFNHQMFQIEFSFNQINAIDRRFLDHMHSLSWLFLQRNPCVYGGGVFIVNPGPNEIVQDMEEGLRRCYENYESQENF